MRVLDALVHASERPAADLARWAEDGVVALVEPLRRPDGPWTHEASFRDRVAALVEHEPARAAAHGLRHLQVLGVPSGGAHDLAVAMRCVEAVRPWLEWPTAVGVGPLSLGSGSEDDEELLKRQLDLAMEVRLPAVVLARGDEPSARVRRVLEIAADMGVPLGSLLLAGDEEAALGLALDAGAWLAVLAGPGRGAERAAATLRLLGPERVAVASAASRDADDPHVLARVAVVLREGGADEAAVERFLSGNALAFFGRSGKLGDLLRGAG